MMTLLSLKVLKSSKIQEPKYLESETCFVQIKKKTIYCTLRTLLSQKQPLINKEDII